jgi:hypothetical protein
MIEIEPKFKVGDLVAYRLHFKGTKKQIGLVLEMKSIVPADEWERSIYAKHLSEYKCKVLWFREPEVMLWSNQDNLKKVSHD